MDKQESEKKTDTVPENNVVNSEGQLRLKEVLFDAATQIKSGQQAYENVIFALIKKIDELEPKK